MRQRRTVLLNGRTVNNAVKLRLTTYGPCPRQPANENTTRRSGYFLERRENISKRYTGHVMTKIPSPDISEHETKSARFESFFTAKNRTDAIFSFTTTAHATIIAWTSR